MSELIIPPLPPGDPPPTRDDQAVPTTRPADVPPSQAPPPTAATGGGAVPGRRTRVEEVSGYEVLGELGRGGMGVVYKARQTSLNRTVALKVLLHAGHATPEEHVRFLREAEALAQLRHENVVQVYEAGVHGGAPFFSMEHVGGGSLADYLRGTPVTPSEAARLAEALARGVQAAHEAGIIHRDLKPANVLLEGGGEQPGAGREGGARPPLSSFRAKVSDFGLARRADQPGLSRSGAVLGTPSYMAPEQAAGKTHEVGPSADVYALGAILYECLTGRPPFRGPTLAETLEQVRSHEPVPPRALQAGVPRDLETICLKCLHKEPKKRYASAADLAADLRRFLDGELIQARGFNMFERLARGLGRSHYDREFRTWGNLLLLLTPVPLLAHLLVFVLALRGLPYAGAVMFLPLALFAAILGVLFWHHRSAALLPVGTAQRQVWSLMTGGVVGGALAWVTTRQLAGPGGPVDELAAYPAWSILTGVLFFALGGSYWGRFYVMGLSHFALAVLMPLSLTWAPVAFGLLVSGTFAATGLHLRRLGEEAAREPSGTAESS